MAIFIYKKFGLLFAQRLFLQVTIASIVYI